MNSLDLPFTVNNLHLLMLLKWFAWTVINLPRPNNAIILNKKQVNLYINITDELDRIYKQFFLKTKLEKQNRKININKYKIMIKNKGKVEKPYLIIEKLRQKNKNTNHLMKLITFLKIGSLIKISMRLTLVIKCKEMNHINLNKLEK